MSATQKRRAVASTTPGMARKEVALVRDDDTKHSPTVSPFPEPITHDYAVGDRVRFECPGQGWHGETGTIVPPLNYVIKGTHFVRMDNAALNGESGFAAARDTFLRRVEPLEGAGA